jgi:hypothetical protein
MLFIMMNKAGNAKRVATGIAARMDGLAACFGAATARCQASRQTSAEQAQEKQRCAS